MEAYVLLGLKGMQWLKTISEKDNHDRDLNTEVSRMLKQQTVMEYRICRDTARIQIYGYKL